MIHTFIIKILDNINIIKFTKKYPRIRAKLLTEILKLRNNKYTHIKLIKIIPIK